ncbi:hypothetical protein GCM10023080_083710 [Streptomyces pseudoechinosporeus]
MSVQQDGRLQFPRMHIAEQRGPHIGPDPRLLPVLRGREQRHARAAAGGFLHHIAQHVVPAMSVDQYQGVDARATKRVGYVPYHRVECHRGNTDRPRPGGVFVRAGDGQRREEMHRVRGGDLTGDGAGDDGVSGQG